MFGTPKWVFGPNKGEHVETARQAMLGQMDLRRCTLPETNSEFALENQWLKDEISFWISVYETK